MHTFSSFTENSKERTVIHMGKDRQEKKMKKDKRVQESDRDQALHYGGATQLEGPEEARKRQR